MLDQPTLTPPRHPSERRPWLRLVLAVAVLALYTWMALVSGGVARADDPPTTDNKADPKTGAETSQQADPPAGEIGGPEDGRGPKFRDTLRDKLEPRFGSRPGPSNALEPKRTRPTSAADAAPPSGRPAPEPEPPADPKPEPTGVPKVDTPPAVQAETPTEAPTETPTGTPTIPDVPTPNDTDVAAPPPAEPPAAPRHHPVQGRQSPPGAPLVDRPRTIAVTDSSIAPRATFDETGVAARQSAGPTQPAARTPESPSASPSQTSVPSASFAELSPTIAPAPRPSLGRQVIGLVSDGATLVLSVVHAVATGVAHAFGPDSLLGVPYLLANSVANVAAGAARSIVGAPAYDSDTDPFPVSYGLLDVAAFFNPTKAPAGANDPTITVTEEHPLPVILINGTVETQGLNWSVGAPVLANAGYKVYTFNYGNVTSDPNFPVQSLDDIRDSAQQLSDEVDRVLAETGAEKVILIGHSQGGGIMPAYYINELGGDEKVSQLIGLAPSNHGTTFNGLAYLTRLPILGSLVAAISDAFAPALFQQVIGSPFQDEVYGDGDTRPGVRYTTIATANDWVVTPFPRQALDGDPSYVTNIVLQQRYPSLVQGHLNVVLSPQTWAEVLAALEANPEANPMPVATNVAA